MKGSRVQAVVQELRGEKIDIVPYDRRSGALRVQRDRAGRGRARHHRRRQPHDGAHRPRRQAVAGHRQEGPERAPRVAAHRLAHRHPLGVEGARDGGAGAPVAGGDQGGATAMARARPAPATVEALFQAGWRSAAEVAARQARTSWRRSPASAASRRRRRSSRRPREAAEVERARHGRGGRARRQGSGGAGREGSGSGERPGGPPGMTSAEIAR